MPQETRERTRTTPRAILLTAIEAATVAGGPDELITEMWSHAALVARVARDLAPMAGVDPADAAAAGLLHDVGGLLLLSRRGTAYTAVIDAGLGHGEQLRLEKSMFGVDHALLGAEHLLDLRIAHVVADAVADHHDPFADSAATTVVVAAADEIGCGEPGRRHALDLLGIAPETAAMILRSSLEDATDSVVPSDRDRSLTQ